jgi:hypothetical protein
MKSEDKDNDITGFLLEIQKQHLKIESIIKEYGFQDSVISLSLCGVVVESGDNQELKAIYGYNMPDKETLEEIIDFIRQTYDPPSDDDDSLDDLLDGLGISLN